MQNMCAMQAYLLHLWLQTALQGVVNISTPYFPLTIGVHLNLNNFMAELEHYKNLILAILLSAMFNCSIRRNVHHVHNFQQYLTAPYTNHVQYADKELKSLKIWNTSNQQEAQWDSRRAAACNRISADRRVQSQGWAQCTMNICTCPCAKFQL